MANALRERTIRLAYERADLRPHLLSLVRTATEFPTQDALNKYLKEHPDADKSKHTVKKDDSKGGGADKKEKHQRLIKDTLKRYDEGEHKAGDVAELYRSIFDKEPSEDVDKMFAELKEYAGLTKKEEDKPSEPEKPKSKSKPKVNMKGLKGPQKELANKAADALTGDVDTISVYERSTPANAKPRTVVNISGASESVQSKAKKKLQDAYGPKHAVVELNKGVFGVAERAYDASKVPTKAHEVLDRINMTGDLELEDDQIKQIKSTKGGYDAFKKFEAAFPKHKISLRTFDELAKALKR